MDATTREGRKRASVPRFTPEQRRRFCKDVRIVIPISEELRERLDDRIEPPETMAGFVRRLLERELDTVGSAA